MKPYIEKNDGVPDNNRYSEALEAAKETVEALNKLTDQALAQYTALVDSAVAGHITDERELEHIMDGLLDFGDDLRFLEIYKRLCRHIFYKHPQMVGEHIYLWRMQFDTKDEEDENDKEHDLIGCKKSRCLSPDLRRIFGHGGRGHLLYGRTCNPGQRRSQAQISSMKPLLRHGQLTAQQNIKGRMPCIYFGLNLFCSQVAMRPPCVAIIERAKCLKLLI